MIILDILKIKSLIKYARSVTTFLKFILNGKISIKTKFEEYPMIACKGKIQIGKNVFLGKNISFKIQSGGLLDIHDGAVISNNCSFNVRENSKIKIGSDSRINSGAIISGDVHIENNVIVAPNVVMISDSHRIGEGSMSIDEADDKLGLKLGTIKIKSNAFIGVGSVILHDIEIGKDAVVGAQTTVIKDIDSKTIVVGAKPINLTPKK